MPWRSTPFYTPHLAPRARIHALALCRRSMSDTPCRVRRVVVRGNNHTHDSVVRQELHGLKEARTLGEIGELCGDAIKQLHGLGIFESAEMLMDAAPGRSADDLPLADVHVTIREKQRGLASATTGVHTQSGEGSMDAQVHPNQP